MCILFVTLVKDPKGGQFKLILATNRDEFFVRPSKPAQFWEDCPHILGGCDMTEHKEGGTWLAISKTGRLGVVLNLSGSPADPQKKGRGFLIVDYLKLQNSDYLDSLIKSGHLYNKFHFLTVEFGGEPILRHYSNGNKAQRITTVTDGTFAVGNSPVDEPYLKVKKGKERFQSIVTNYGNAKDKNKLVEELLDLLKWQEKHVDPTGKEMAHLPQAFRDACTSVFIDVPQAGYGTRTHTIILVDSNGETDFYEWTLKEPIDPNKKEWMSSHYNFTVPHKS